MNARLIALFVGCGALVGSALAPTAAQAAPPPNNNRANAIRVTPPQQVTGTLVEAGIQSNDVSSQCAETDGAVWYRFTAAEREAIVARLDAAGDMDATIDLYQRTRSRLTPVDCAETDKKGVATIDDDGLTAGDEYVLRIGNQTGSTPDEFELRVAVPSPPPHPPGAHLSAGGGRGKVDRLANPGDAYWKRLRAGHTMRMSLDGRYCTELSVYEPGTKSFRSDNGLAKRLRCGGYRLFTPDTDGRYYFVVTAGRSRDVQPYRLQVAPARRDDTAPGVFIRNNAVVKGKLNGAIDSLDLYRFDVTSRSTLSLKVSGGPSLRLVTAGGHRLGSGDMIDRNVRAGRYFVAVEGAGKYTLRRVSRTITSAKLRFNGHKRATIRPGTRAAISLRVRPSVDGRGTIEVERLDPIDGWQFLRRFGVSVSGGRGTVSFTPPAVGRYRASAEYHGNRVAAGSATGVAHLRVQSPLVD